jgi:hypothetical protein
VEVPQVAAIGQGAAIGQVPLVCQKQEQNSLRLAQRPAKLALLRFSLEVSVARKVEYTRSVRIGTAITVGVLWMVHAARS